MDVRWTTLAAAAALAVPACSGRIAALSAGRAASSADSGSEAAPVPADDDAGATADASDAGDAAPAFDAPAEAATPPGPPLPASCPDGTPRNPSGMCTDCAMGTVCCTQAVGCAGCCVPDCRLGNRPCMSGLVCDDDSGVCMPQG